MAFLQSENHQFFPFRENGVVNLWHIRDLLLTIFKIANNRHIFLFIYGKAMCIKQDYFKIFRIINVNYSFFSNSIELYRHHILLTFSSHLKKLHSTHSFHSQNKFFNQSFSV